ncbi:MAG: hypothetical protein CMM01_01095 [Rhodopirellula sp.]|nr:hypothetical protein [Rhodopirellula sp.]
MQDFRQLCPSCKQTLELPVSASGKLAQCPACETTFTADAKLSQATVAATSPDQTEDDNESVDSVASETARKNASEPVQSREPLQTRELVEQPANPIDSGLANPINPPAVDEAHSQLPPLSATQEPAAEEPAAEEPQPQSTREPILEGVNPSKGSEESAVRPENLDANQLYSAESNPFSQPLLQKSVVTEPSSLFVNSNEISNKHVAARAQITIVPCSTVELFKTTWAIMLDRGLMLIASLLFLSFIIAATLVTGSVATWILSQFISDSVMFMVYCVALTLIITLATISICRNAIGVIRNTPHIVRDSLFTFRSLLNILVPAILILAVASYYKWLLLPSYAIDLTVTVLIGLCTIGTLGWFWISIFLCCDMQCSGFKSLVMAARVFYHNKTSTLALISFCTGLMLLGIASKGILLIVAVPFIQLLLATSYLMLTNQPFANPRYLIADDETS